MSLSDTFSRAERIQRRRLNRMDHANRQADAIVTMWLCGITGVVGLLLGFLFGLLIGLLF